MKKRCLAWVLMMTMVLTGLSTQVLAEENGQLSELPEETVIGVLDYMDKTVETTPRPRDGSFELMEISEQQADVTMQRYQNLISADPEMFLLTEAGIGALNWTGTPTSKEMAWLQEKALEITDGCSTAGEKIYEIMKYLSLNICYDNDYYYGRTTVDELNLNPYDVLKGESSVCEGYARTAAALLQLVDVPCVVVDSPNHKWNIAHDGERWIMLDTTWVSNGTKDYGVLYKSDELWLDWYDFTIEDAVGNVNHLIDALPYDIVDGVLSHYPVGTRSAEATIPSSVTSVTATFKDDIDTLYLAKTVESIGRSAFNNADVEKVLYAGTKEQYDDISIASYNKGLTGAYVSYLDEASAPYITKHPSDQMTDFATGVTLCVEAEATGNADISYQWYENTGYSTKGGMPVDGATEPELTLAYTEAGEYYYYAEVLGTDTNVSGVQTTSVFTAPVKVTVYPEIPSKIVQIGDHVFCYYYEQMQEIHLAGYGPVDESMVKYLYLSSESTIRIDAGITDLPEQLLQKNCFPYAKAFVVEEGNTAYASDDAGALLDLKNQELLLLPYYSGVTEYVIPEGIVSVREGAIRNRELQYLSIPASLEAFYGGLRTCYNLNEIYLDSGNEAFYLDDMGALIDKEGQRIIRLPAKRLSWGTIYEIDPEIKIIEEYAFYNCQCLDHVSIPDGVTKIGDSAFAACYNLKGDLVLPSSLTTIGNDAFKWCDEITGNLKIPEGVQSIGSEAFLGCKSLTGVELPAGLTKLGFGAFSQCIGITGTVVIPEGVTVAENSLFYGCTSLQAVVFPVGLTDIENDVFADTTALTAVTIPETVYYIADNAFTEPANVTVYGCTGSYAEEYAGYHGMPFVDITCHVESIKLKEGSALSMLAGTTICPELIVTPAQTTDAIAMASSDTDVVKVLPGRRLEAVDAGTATITVCASGGASCTFTVKVQKVQSLHVTALPERVRYSTGEELDLTGMVVTATFTDDTSEEVQGYTVTGYRKDREGTQEICISYGGKDTSFTVTVSEPLGGSWGEALAWECLYGTDVSVNGVLPEGCKIFVASYGENHQQVAFAIITDLDETVVIDEKTDYLQFFCVGQNLVPQGEKLCAPLRE